ncbi:hypothetical protein Q31a_06810 [Aureliella helgolandensis]|uniref:Uncharacterized protein n=1 Tax=Aureliella helgolandensis TaxID=2527968 RepID=A0A518G1E2_9BACT|nr:hypothetical protein Q31a_06810 [Aureliella helgolandensis]
MGEEGRERTDEMLLSGELAWCYSSPLSLAGGEYSEAESVVGRKIARGIHLPAPIFLPNVRLDTS